MNNPLFEQAKQAVSKKYGYDDPSELFNNLSFWEDVFKRGCNEAVKADRKQIAEDFDFNELEYKGNVVDHLSYINQCFPLPFPQQPDGI